MNKHLKNILLYMFLGILLLIPCVVAYDISYLSRYYTWADGNNATTIYDTHSGTIMNVRDVSGTGLISAKGIVGYGLFSLGEECILGNSTFSLGDNSFTLNFWMNISKSGHIYNYLENLDCYASHQHSNAIKIDFSSNESNLKSIEFSYYTSGWNGFLSSLLNSLNLANNNFHMFTIVYNVLTSNFTLYIDSIYINTAIYDINSNITKYIFGMINNTYDDTALFFTPLLQNDIDILYNNGSGLNYNQTILNNETAITDGCIDINTYCYNRHYSYYGYYYCNSKEESQFCRGGCYNDFCNITGKAECGIIGESKCLDTTNYAICSDSDYDGYLDYGEIHTCSLGTYCVDGFHHYFCNNVTMNGTHDKYSIIVTPYAISNENTSYILDSNTKTVNVETVFSLHNQQFYTTGTTYITRTCDYQENSLYSYGQQNINTSTDFDMTSATNQNTIIRLSFTPNEYANGSINIISQSAMSDGSIKYIRNATAKRICIYDNSDNEIYCDYDYTGGDTLQAVELEYTYDFSSKTYTIRMTFDRTFTQTKITYPQTFVGNDIYRINIDSNDTILNSIVIVNIPSFNHFTTTQNNALRVSPCLFTSNGLYKVRTYGNNNGMPDFASYTDYNVNIIKLGSTSTDVARASGLDNAMLGQGLSKGTKYLIVLFTIMVEIIGFTALGFGIKMVQSSFIVGSIFAVFTLIIFTIFGWISWIVIVILLIVAIAISILLSKTNTNMENG